LNNSFRLPLSLGFCILAAIAAFFLWQEHRNHILGALPLGLRSCEPRFMWNRALRALRSSSAKVKEKHDSCRRFDCYPRARRGRAMLRQLCGFRLRSSPYAIEWLSSPQVLA
jgi:hypothetical protein